jgi:hypothetical protein
VSYYMGDFYASNRSMYGFPRGDPGFFSFLGGLAKKAVGFIPGVGPIASAALSAIPSRAKGGAVSTAVSAARTGIVKAGGAIVKHPALSAAGAAGALAVGAGARSLLHHRGAARGPTASGRRHPRMNPCNPRALRRAINRTHRFAKLAMKTIHLVHPKKKARFGGFKRRKRSK